MFIDRVVLRLAAGKGGNGVVAWRREKYIPKGGPTGGNGGRGGAVILRADVQTVSLENFRYRKVLQAENGQGGGGQQMRGRNGTTLILKVPCGTLVKSTETGELLCDLTEPSQEFVICNGGFGGRGNACFATPTNRAPNTATHGMPGAEIEAELELKLIADVGLVGFPNAGKSTFIKHVANTHVKIAPYPFTTLKPNLGYVQFDDYTRLLFADIPGIIKGASQNKGLGFEFLRHIERTKALIYMLDASCIDDRHPLDDFQVLRDELSAYDGDLIDRPFVVVLNKMDVEGADEIAAEFRSKIDLPQDKIFEISAQEKDGVDDVVQATRLLLKGSTTK